MLNGEAVLLNSEMRPNQELPLRIRLDLRVMAGSVLHITQISWAENSPSDYLVSYSRLVWGKNIEWIYDFPMDICAKWNANRSVQDSYSQIQFPGMIAITLRAPDLK